MFGAKYSRLTFWIWSVILIIPFHLFSTFSRATASDSELANSSLIFSGLVFIVILMWINALANRIRDYGSNPWIAVFSLIPLANIGLALYYGIVKYKNKPIENNTVSNNSNPSLVKAVYNHSKDIASEVKPTINEYKERHQTSKTDTSNILSIDEDEIYEKVMLEIEEDNKVKSTWARALVQSEGNRDKAEAMYINLRVKDLQNQVQVLSNKINKEIIEPVLDKNENQYKKFGEEEKAKVLNEKNNNFNEKQNYKTIENKLKENYGNFDEIELLLIKEKYNHLSIFEKSRLEYLKDYNSAKNLNNALINKNLELAYLELKNLDNLEDTILNKLEEYGFIMLSKIIVRKAGTWEDYKYIVENNLIKIFDLNNTLKQEIKL